MGIAEAIIALIQYAPTAINEVTAVYNAIKGDLSATDQAAIEQALADAQEADAKATSAADKALDDAANR